MRALLVAGLLFAQTPDGPDLMSEWRMASGVSRLAMVTLIAHYPDGTPVRGEIQCSGSWYKHQDGVDALAASPSLPFATDARGAVIVNPSLEDEAILCWCESRGLTGRVWVDLDPPTGVYEIVLGRDS